MNISVSSRAISIDDELHEKIDIWIYFALSRFSPRIDEAMVHLSEVFGASGKSQRLCRLSVRMKNLGSFSIETVEDEVAVAVSRAAERAAKQVQRILDRQRDELRRP